MVGLVGVAVDDRGGDLAWLVDALGERVEQARDHGIENAGAPGVGAQRNDAPCVTLVGNLPGEPIGFGQPVFRDQAAVDGVVADVAAHQVVQRPADAGRAGEFDVVDQLAGLDRPGPMEVLEDPDAVGVEVRAVDACLEDRGEVVTRGHLCDQACTG